MRDRLDVGGGWFDEIDNGDIGNGISLRIDAPGSRVALVIKSRRCERWKSLHHTSE